MPQSAGKPRTFLIDALNNNRARRGMSAMYHGLTTLKDFYGAELWEASNTARQKKRGRFRPLK